MCSKGSVIIAHGAWWHSQGVNRTSTPRTCLLATFVPKWIVSKDDLVAQFYKMPLEWRSAELYDTLT